MVKMSVAPYDLESVLTKLSDFGTYQKRNFFLISLAIIFSAVQYGYIFTTRTTKYRCFIEECDVLGASNGNKTVEADWLQSAIPFEGGIPRKCERFAANTRENERSCNKDSFNKLSIEKCENFIFENGDLTIERDFQLTCDENLWKLAILGSLDEFGEVVYLPLLGYLSDCYGRRTLLIICLVLSSISGTIKSFATSYYFFAFMEFITACFTSGIYSAGFILGVELLVPDKRVFGSTIITTAFPVGEIILGLVAWFSPSWRFMLRVLYAPGLLFLTYFYLMDESVRFLITNGKEERAHKILKHIAKVNNVVISEDINIRPGEPTQGEPQKAAIQKEYFVQVFRYPRLLLRILNCSFSWISCTFVFYGLTIYSVSLTGNLYLNFIIMAVIEVPAYAICYYTLKEYGRRLSLAGPLLLSGTACLCYIFVPEDQTIARLLLPILGKFAATMAFKTIYIYTAEMFPTTLRHTLLALCSMFGRAGAIAAPQLPLLAHITPALPLMLFGCLAITSGFTAFFLPETKGRKLPNTIEDALELEKSSVCNKIV